MSQPPPDPPPPVAYEPPDDERPATAMPTERELESNVPSVRVLDYSPEPAGHDAYAALRNPVYRLFIGNYQLAVIGSQVMSVAVAWAMYQKTHLARTLGLVAGIQALPVILLALPAGHASDAFSRKRVLMITQVALVLCAAALAALAGFAWNWKQFVPAAYAIILLNACALAFARPARASILPLIVPKSMFGNAVTWNATMFEIASITGPAIGGVTIARWGIATALWFSAACTLVCLWLTQLLPSFPAAKRGEPINVRTLLAGVAFVWRTRLLLATMTLDLFAVLLGGATYLLPVFAERLGVGSVGFGWLRAAPSVGAILMAMLIAHTPPMKHAGRALLIAVTGFGAATIVFGMSRSFTLSLFMLFLTGVFDNVSVVVRHTLVQLLTPDEMRGRVSAVNQVFIGSSNELGGLESGYTADWFGPVVSVVGGGIGTILVVIGVALFFPDVRKFGALQSAQEQR